MIALLLALATLTPLEQWKTEILCQQPDDATPSCRPRVVNLGCWDPRPLEWDTSPFNAPVAPPPSRGYNSTWPEP